MPPSGCTRRSARGTWFNLIHEPDNGRIGYVETCKVDGKEVPSDEIVKAYEISKGEYVTLTDEDFDAARVKGGHSITIHDFGRSSRLTRSTSSGRTTSARGSAGEAIYALLPRRWRSRAWLRSPRTCDPTARTLHASASATASSRSSGCLRRRGALVEGIAPSAAKVDKRQLEMARDLIGAYTRPSSTSPSTRTLTASACSR